MKRPINNLRGMKPEDLNKSIKKTWKEKAVARNLEIQSLKKRVKELTDSRDNWKEKHRILRQEVGYQFLSMKTEKPIQHSYPTLVIWFCVQAQSYGTMSLRGCVQVLLCLRLVSGKLNQKLVPSYSSVRNWCCKAGYYRLNYQGSTAQGKWIYFVDESISLGKERILLVLGVPVEHLRFEESLSLRSVRVLSVELAKSWKGADIVTVLEKLQSRFPMAYVVSDEGNNLRKSYQLLDCLHIPDCGHRLANIIEKLYRNDPFFVEFSKKAASLRRKWSLSQYAAYMPPVQRSKARFANLFPVVEWAYECLKVWKKFPPEVQSEAGFIKENTDWVREFYAIQQRVVYISKILKNNGFSAKIHRKLKRRLLKRERRRRVKKFIKQALAYLEVLAEKVMTQHHRIYCSSDVIESAFGKFKQKINPKSSQAMSEFVLTLASIGSDYSEEEIKKAMENTKEEDIRNWRKKAPSLAQQRKEIFDEK